MDEELTAYEYMITSGAAILQDVTRMMASSEDIVRLQAARQIPDGTDLETVEVLVRPFLEETV